VVLLHEGNKGEERMLGSNLQGSRGDGPVARGEAESTDRVDGVDGVDRTGETGEVERADGGMNGDGGVHGGLDQAECWAEEVHVFERLITAPVAGTFHPSYSDITVDNPVMIAIGDEIGVLVQSGEKHAVESPFTGLLMGLIALPGERVKAHQPLAWLTTDDDLLWD
jgi:hypothetical protein